MKHEMKLDRQGIKDLYKLVGTMKPRWLQSYEKAFFGVGFAVAAFILALEAAFRLHAYATGQVALATAATDSLLLAAAAAFLVACLFGDHRFSVMRILDAQYRMTRRLREQEGVFRR